MKWITLEPVFKNDFIRETEKAVLLSLSDTFFSVWVPKSLLKHGRYDDTYEFVLPPDMKFRIVWNHLALGECTPKEIHALYFGDKTVRKEVWKRFKPEKKSESWEVHHQPDKIKPVRREADDSLKR